jgi:hypothetical protein
MKNTPRAIKDIPNGKLVIENIVGSDGSSV